MPDRLILPNFTLLVVFDEFCKLFLHYAAFSFYLLILLPEVQIISLALCSQTFGVCTISIGVIKVLEESEIIFFKPPTQ